MYLFDALMVFALCILGSFVIWLVATVSTAWKRRRDEDAEFQRSLAYGGVLTETGEKTGVHAFGTVTVGQLVEREVTSEITMGLPIAGRVRSSE